MSSIVIFLPYFGKLPNYFGFWYQSCINNPTIDWFIFTDCNTSSYMDAPNMNVIKLTFSDFRKKFTEYFDFEITMKNPYKLCDYRPFFGEVLKEYAARYTFWGYCDCDLIFGDIRKFATEEILAKCDKFLGHGHFSLHRTINSQYLNILESVKNRGQYTYHHVYTNDMGFAYDEYDHMGLSYNYLIEHGNKFYSGYNSNRVLFKTAQVLYQGGSKQSSNTPGDSVCRIYDDVYSDVIHFRDRIKDKRMGRRKIIYCYKNGRLFRLIMNNLKTQKEEILYLHLMKRPMKVSTAISNRFLIVPNRFTKYINTPTRFYIWRHGRRRVLKTWIYDLREYLELGARWKLLLKKLRRR